MVISAPVALICRGCGGPTGKVIDLGRQSASDDFPLAGDRSEDARWPLELWLCSDCTLAQLGPVEAQLPQPVLAIESETSRQHARTSVTSLLADYPSLEGCTVREFASHHGGSWLPELERAGCHPVRPAEPARLVVD